MNEFKTRLSVLMENEEKLQEYRTDPVTWWVKLKNKIKTLCIEYSRILQRKVEFIILCSLYFWTAHHT